MKGVVFVLALLTFTAQAGITTKIAKIYAPTSENPNYEVLAIFDGMVFEVTADNEDVLTVLRQAVNTQREVEMEVQESADLITREFPDLIVEAKLLEPAVHPQTTTTEPSTAEYVPSKVATLEDAEEMFQSLYQSSAKSECFNRAHFWNRQLHKDYGVRSEKIFIFYTRKYRGTYRRWRWWFHTAPLVRVNGQPTVLDREYTTGPVSEEAWEWQFNGGLRDYETKCVRIDAISKYYDRYNTYNNFCNILTAPMYYWEPNHLKRLENRGQTRNDWVDWEIRHAARDMFRRWVSAYERYRVF